MVFCNAIEQRKKSEDLQNGLSRSCQTGLVVFDPPVGNRSQGTVPCFRPSSPRITRFHAEKWTSPRPVNCYELADYLCDPPNRSLFLSVDEDLRTDARAVIVSLSPVLFDQGIELSNSFLSEIHISIAEILFD
jgi:hypothetical protein